MSPNPAQAPTSRKEEKRPRTDRPTRGQTPTNPHQSPADVEKLTESEQDQRVRRSNQAGDQDVDDSADTGGDDQGPDGTR